MLPGRVLKTSCRLLVLFAMCILQHSAWCSFFFNQSLKICSRDARKNKIALSLGYHGNVVDLW